MKPILKIPYIITLPLPAEQTPYFNFEKGNLCVHICISLLAHTYPKLDSN